MAAYLRFRVELMAIKPRIFRTFLITVDATFSDLHKAIVDAGPWGSGHSFCFACPGEGQSLIEPDGDEMSAGALVADACLLVAYFGNPTNRSLIYTYDLSERWQHCVTLEETVQERARFRRRLIAGARAFPKADMGGIDRYRELVAIAKGTAPDTPRTRNCRHRLRGWDPEFFDLAIQQEIFDED